MKRIVKPLLVAFWTLMIAFMPFAADEANADHDNAVVLKVGGYPFEPFVDDDQGITADFIALLNRSQQQIHFEFVPIPSQRRYELMRREVIDAVFFEMPVWGWQGFEEDVEVSSSILRGTEVFVARRDSSTEDLFGLSHDRKVALTLGYHYAFAGFNSDQNHLRTIVDPIFAEKVSQTLRYLRSGAADMAVMSDIFLLSQYEKNPNLQSELTIGPVPDHDYSLPVIIHKSAPVTAQQIDDIVNGLRKSGELARFFEQYGLDGLVLNP